MASLVERAEMFAKGVHAMQPRKYTGEKYAVHLEEVAKLVASVGSRDEVVASAWLHDSKEDQGITDQTLRFLFGNEVADLVEMVTDQSKPEDGNRAARKAIDHEHLRNASPEGKTIKLADLISNTKSIVARDPHFAVKYMQEKRALLPLLKEGNPVLYARALKLLEEYERKTA